MEFTDESRLYLKKGKRNATGGCYRYIEIPGKPGEPGKLDTGAVTGWQPTTQIKVFKLDAV